MKKMTPEEFVAEFLDDAQANETKHGVPALLTLAQAAVESGWGKHAPGLNFFGIKADPSWHGPKQNLPTREVIGGKSVVIPQWFRAYTSAEQSFADHAAFLRKWPRYAKVFETTDPRVAARAVAAAGYATDPNYAEVLIQVIALLEGAMKARPAPRPLQIAPAPRRTLWAVIADFFAALFRGK